MLRFNPQTGRYEDDGQQGGGMLQQPGRPQLPMLQQQGGQMQKSDDPGAGQQGGGDAVAQTQPADDTSYLTMYGQLIDKFKPMLTQSEWASLDPAQMEQMQQQLGGIGTNTGQLGANAQAQAGQNAALMQNLGGQAGGMSADYGNRLRGLSGLSTLLSGDYGQQFQGLGGQAGDSMRFYNNQFLDLAGQMQQAGQGGQFGDLSNQAMNQIGQSRDLYGNLSKEQGKWAGNASDAYKNMAGQAGQIGNQSQQQLGDLSQRYGDIGQQGSQAFGGLSDKAQTLRQGYGQDLRGIQNELMRTSGGNDPRFDARAQSLLKQTESDFQNRSNLLNENMSRTGMTGSSALREQDRLAQSIGQQRADIQSSLGMEQMGRQDTALLNAANVAGQGAGLESGFLGQQGQFTGAGQDARMSQLGAQSNLAQQNIGNQQQSLQQQGQFREAGLNAQQQAMGNQATYGQANLGNVANSLTQAGGFTQQGVGNEMAGLQGAAGMMGQGAGAAGTFLGQQGQFAGQGAAAQQGFLGQSGQLLGQGAGIQQGFLGQQGQFANQGLAGQQAGQALGMQGNQQQAGYLNQNLANQGAMVDSQNNAQSQQFDAWQSAIQNAMIPKTLTIAETAANKGGSPTVMPGGGLGGFGKALCTVARDRGDIPDGMWKADELYGMSVSPEIRAGYLLWAWPLAGFLRRHRWAYLIFRPLIRAWANDMAGRMGLPYSSVLGHVLNTIGEPICAFLGAGYAQRAVGG